MDDRKDRDTIALDDKETETISEIPVAPTISKEDLELLTTMTEAGVHYGRRKSKVSPLMADAVYAVRNNMSVIDVSKTLEHLRAATAFLGSCMERGGMVLVVGTQPALRDLIISFAQKFSFPYVIERWLGGTITNFKIMSGRITHLKKLKEDKAAGRHAKYSKKEQLMIQREIDRLQRFLGGLEKMDRLPDAIFLVDIEMHTPALREAKKSGKVAVVGLVNTDGRHVKDVTYAVPMNTSGRASVEWVLNFITKELEGKRKNADAAPSAAISI